MKYDINTIDKDIKELFKHIQLTCNLDVISKRKGGVTVQGKGNFTFETKGVSSDIRWIFNVNNHKQPFKSLSFYIKDGLKCSIKMKNDNIYSASLTLEQFYQILDIMKDSYYKTTDTKHKRFFHIFRAIYPYILALPDVTTISDEDNNKLLEFYEIYDNLQMIEKSIKENGKRIAGNSDKQSIINEINMLLDKKKQLNKLLQENDT